MIQFEGQNGVVKIFTDLVEDVAVQQVKEMAESPITENTVMRIMPDVHAGKGSTIGTTIKLSDKFSEWKVSPNVVGSDVGCGILMYKLADKDIDLEKLDKVVNELIPSGKDAHKVPQFPKFTKAAIQALTFVLKEESKERVELSLGTLGDGNHFIELGIDNDGDYWLSVHSGSRNLGAQVARHHQKQAIKELTSNKKDIAEMIEKMKSEGHHKEIQSAIMEFKKNNPELTQRQKELAHLSGDSLKKYLNDMDIAQQFASKSRKTMLEIIVDSMGFEVVDSFDSVHNFIEHQNLTKGYIRKGATSAKLGERLVIPLNMKDGVIIASGKGNEDWNYSAPHGAGRLMSRTKAREKLTVEQLQEEMSGVFTTSISEETVDESPLAYKPASSIIETIKDTVDILHIVKPVYNFKAH